MNQRIKELDQQAVDYANNVCDANGIYKGKEYLTVVKEKFAELLVRECAQQCFDLADKLPTGDFPAGLKMLAYNIAGETIKEHFGVEE